MNSQWILNIFFFVQIHLKKSDFIFVARLRRNERYPPFLSHVCGGFNIFFLASSFASIYIQQNARHIVRPNSIFVQKQNILYKTPSALRILTKYIKFPRLYSFLLFKYFNVFSKCACSPRAVKNSYMSIRHRNSRCV